MKVVASVVHLVRPAALALPVSAVIGSSCALFLWSLDLVTRTRFAQPWLLWLLPFAGVGIAWMYRLAGRSAEAGTNLILEEIHEPRAGVPRRMAPLILASTIVTHLFGGSAGREGTAVQIGGGVASAFGQWLKLPAAEVRLLLMIGIAAGFGGVFGTPIAGAIFALEVIFVGEIYFAAALPCLIAAFVGHWSCVAWGIEHVEYIVGPSSPNATLLAGAIVVGIASGQASKLFVWLMHLLHGLWKVLVPIDWLRTATGGLVVISLVSVVGTRDYLGLGVVSPDQDGVSIVSSFQPGGADWLSPWWKTLFTAVTLSSGFKGGEVTPLFFIGAALGNDVARFLSVRTDILAALGFVAVFAGATRTPLACAVMGVELFGPSHAGYLLIACYLSHMFSGRTGIYAAQRRVLRQEAAVHLRPSVAPARP